MRDFIEHFVTSCSRDLCLESCFECCHKTSTTGLGIDLKSDLMNVACQSQLLNQTLMLSDRPEIEQLLIQDSHVKGTTKQSTSKTLRFRPGVVDSSTLVGIYKGDKLGKEMAKHTCSQSAQAFGSEHIAAHNQVPYYESENPTDLMDHNGSHNPYADEVATTKAAWEEARLISPSLVRHQGKPLLVPVIILITYISLNVALTAIGRSAWLSSWNKLHTPLRPHPSSIVSGIYPTRLLSQGLNVVSTYLGSRDLPHTSGPMIYLCTGTAGGGETLDYADTQMQKTIEHSAEDEICECWGAGAPTTLQPEPAVPQVTSWR